MLITRELLAHPEGGALSYLKLSAQLPETTRRPLIVFSHGTGLHSQSYLPFLEALTEVADVITWDLRGHGFSTVPANSSQLTSWTLFFSDLNILLEHLARPVILVGHSLGAVCSLGCAGQYPKWVRGVFAIDPVLLDPFQGLGMLMLKMFGKQHTFPLAAGAKRRRASFENIQSAYDSYRNKRTFVNWTEASFQGYIDGAFKTVDANTSQQGKHTVTLRCSPDWESATFASVVNWPWSIFPNKQLPAQFLLAEKQSTCSQRSRRLLKQIRPCWEQHVLPNSNHFLTMEQPLEVAQAVSEFVVKVKI